MHVSNRNTKIIAALVIAVAMVSVSFWFTNTTPRIASALSTDELLRAYVEQDTDDDGLPDWQEEVYGTDPGNPESVEKGLSDAEAVARGLVKPAFSSEELREEITEADIPVDAPASGSLTERFSRQFIQEYLSAGGGTNVSEEEQARIIEGLIATFAREAERQLDSSYTSISLLVVPSLDTTTYIGELEAFLLASLPQVNSDMPGLAKALILEGDMSAGTRLRELSDAYGGMAKTLLRMPVPSSLVEQHLLVIRSYDRVAKAGAVLARYEEDPVAALGALSVFIPAREDILTAFNGYAVAVLANGEPVEGAPGFLTVQYARAQEQQ